jgi:hypothetical protein
MHHTSLSRPVACGVPTSVPKRDPTTILRQQTPTRFPIKNGPEILDFRPVLRFRAALANRRLQPLGHLTAARNLSIRHASSYGEPAVPKIVPEIVPASSKETRNRTSAQAPEAVIRTQRFFSSTSIPATDWRAPLCSHVLASTSLLGRGLRMRGALVFGA